ncbi:thiosulfate sulfurtransferase isoform X3 [Acinonyx jubatus]|uniref:Thiosulfate sulfurtransferase n=1 Tax=Acinonyx jubatus TaxID=32536 RepID=A0ABM3QFM8_ACIJB|nr:thiosulfate sulfurtransferase isoform X3 [Acinonyx jubatus]
MVRAGRGVVSSGFEPANFSSGRGRAPGRRRGRVMRRAETMVHQVLYRALVSTKWLAESVRAGKLGPGLRVLDASWYSPGTREARKEYLERHVPGASFFDIEECRNAASPYEMMLPSEADFAHYVGRLGISNQTHVVVYDGDHLGSFYAPRVWWMFRVFGHRTVSVLNGGFRNWLKEGHPVTSEPSRPEPANFEATLDRSLLKTYEQVLENLESKRFQLVDARSQGRYLGTEPEPDAVGPEPSLAETRGTPASWGWPSLGSQSHGNPQTSLLPRGAFYATKKAGALLASGTRGKKQDGIQNSTDTRALKCTSFGPLPGCPKISKLDFLAREALEANRSIGFSLVGAAGVQPPMKISRRKDKIPTGKTPRNV